MSWYSTPLQPLDPVVASQTPKPPVRYVRDNFTGTGQNSYVQPPAQDQAMWQSLLNVQPITQGVINQRWGYNIFASNAAVVGANRLYNFQSDATGTRAIIAAGLSSVSAYTEAGALYMAPVFTPAGGSGIMRSVTSRDYQYFCDGDNALDLSTHMTGDSVKWDGTTGPSLHDLFAPPPVTNIGILSSDVTPNTASGGTSSLSAGPNTGTSTTDTGGGSPAPSNLNVWQNGGDIFSNNPFTPATVYASNAYPRTDTLQCVGFFSTYTPTKVSGIQVTLNYGSSLAPSVTSASATITMQLVVGGVAFGTVRTAKFIGDGKQHTVTFGNSTDLWGGTLAPANILGTGFGVRVFMSGTSVSPTSAGINTFQIQASYVTITAFSSGSSGTTTSSGNGVGVASTAANGAISLTLGRTYYLVPNNSNTGHFADLSDPSASTGPVTNEEFGLVLATYNDPQVTTKYVLATPDGGDPSILYETQVLSPGLVISSWVINGSNQVTFTGTAYPIGSTFAVGQKYYVGGLVHGSYMNGTQITITGTTATTITANFTHGADSATESGVVGEYTFAIPNYAPFVVDNTPDASLVLNQPLLYTDQYDNEFGVALNDPPPAGTLLCKHQGRLWMSGVSSSPHSVFFSKSVAELTLPNGFIAGKYEESWPGSNYFDVSDTAESVAGLLSNGQTLFIGTQNHIYQLIGNSPVNFQEPQVVHPQVGLNNQEVWQLVFTQGTPSGAIWMTPDFRVIQSDFNTYVDIGTPVQNILNNLQPSAQTLAHSTYASDGEYEVYILAVPYQQSTYCDTHLVFDLKARQWFVWQPLGGSQSLLFNITQAGVPQWLFLGGTDTSNINIYSPFALTDNGSAIPVTATTTWMHLGEPTRRKVLNEIQIYGNVLMNINVVGANNLQDFSNPKQIVDNITLRKSPFDVWTLYMTGFSSHHRYYQFSFSSSNGQSLPLLGSYNVLSTPLDDV